MLESGMIAVDGESLWDMEFVARRFCIRSLLPQGLCILGGAPKIGKSWLMLDWCIRIAKGEPIWDMDTTQGTTLYLCLEDTLPRVQHRIYCMSEEATPNVYFAAAAGTLTGELESQISSFLLSHPDTVLIVVDTYQMVRGNSNEPSYGGDYQDMQKLKRIADEYNITILLVHHLRKQGDRDPVNRLSGTTGISGAVDAVFVLDRKERTQNTALLVCTGRDIEYRELELRFSKERCVWDLLSDSAENPAQLLPPEMMSFLEYILLRRQHGTDRGFQHLRRMHHRTQAAEAADELFQRAIAGTGTDFSQLPQQWTTAGRGTVYRASDASAASDAGKRPLVFASLAFLASLPGEERVCIPALRP